MRKWKLILPWRYIIMLVVGLAVLWVLLWRFGRTDTVLIGWLITWLVVSRGVDFLIRRRRKRVRFENETPP
jgi:hypothetical protein